MLTGIEIKKQIRLGKIKIDPFHPENVNPNSYDLTLYNEFIKYGPHSVLSVRSPSDGSNCVIPPSGELLYPNTLYLFCTNERAGSKYFVPMINGKSSLARLGISVHQTGGFGDLGFIGRWTLEISVVVPVIIFPGMKIAQVSFFRPCGDKSVQYEGKYVDAGGKFVTRSRSYLDPILDIDH